MRLLIYEQSKLAKNRILVILLLVLLAANVVMCAVSVEGRDKTYDDSIDRLLREYNEDPEGFSSRIDALDKTIRQRSNELLMAAMEERKKAREQGINLDVDFDETTYKSYELDGVNRDDRLLFYLKKDMESKDTTSSGIKTILVRLNNSMKTLKYDEGMTLEDYVYFYQAYASYYYSEVYKSLPDKAYSLYGWDQFFSYSQVDVFIFAAALILSASVFLPEKQCGILPNLRSAKKGRARTALAKLTAASLSVVLLTAVFMISVGVVFYFKTGLSDPSAPIQRIEAFAGCPRVSSILGFAFSLFLAKAVGALLFAAFSIFFSLIFYQAIITYLGGGALFVVSYLLKTSGDIFHPEKRIFNLLSLTEFTGFAQRLQTFPLFGYPFDYFYTALGVCAVLLLIFLVGSVLLYVKGVGGVNLRFVKAAGAKCASAYYALKRRFARKSGKGRSRGRSLFSWELIKSFRFCFIWLLLLILLAGEVYIGHSFASNEHGNTNELLYATALEPYKGVMSEEKAGQIKEKYEQIVAIIAKNSFMHDEYVARRITKEAYYDYLDDYSKAKAEEPGMKMVVEQTDYLLKKHEETGIWGHLCETVPFELYYSSGVDLPLYIAVVLFSFSLFAVEYRGRQKGNTFVFIQRTAKNGRNRVFNTKLLLCVLFSLLSSLVFIAVKTAFYASALDFSSSTFAAPLFSVNLFENYGGSMTVAGFTVLYFAVRVLSAIALGLIAFALSVLLTKPVSYFGVLLFTTALPHALVLLGLKIAGYVSFGGLFEVLSLTLFSFEKDGFHLDFGCFILVALLFSLLAAALLTAARRKHVK